MPARVAAATQQQLCAQQKPCACCERGAELAVPAADGNQFSMEEPNEVLRSSKGIAAAATEVKGYRGDKVKEDSKEEQLPAAQKARGHSTKSNLEALRANCEQHSIAQGSNASKLDLCQATLAKAQQQPPQ